MKRRLSAILAGLGTTIAMLALAVPAFAASDDGEGLVGETNDKVITFFSLGLIVFFPLVVTIGTLIQGALERRKEARKAARMRGRVGW